MSNPNRRQSRPVMIEKMAEHEVPSVSTKSPESSDDMESKEVERLLQKVILKRKTYPAKCMKLHRHIVIGNLKRLDNAKVILNENKDKEKIQRTVQSLKRLNTAHISFVDLQEAEKRVQQSLKKLNDIKYYLQARQQYQK